MMRVALAAALIAAGAAMAASQSGSNEVCDGGSCQESGANDDSSLLQKVTPEGNLALPEEGSAKGSKPHIVFMLIDDLGWGNTEFGGSGLADRGFIKTPNMKALQPDSIKLNKLYAYGWCAPSRSSLLSGRLPIHVDVNHSNPMAFIRSKPLDSGEGIPAGMTTIGTKLKGQNYSTHYVGKWGVGFTWKQQNPMWRGFDSFFGYLHDSVDYWNQKLGPESIEVPGGCEKLFRALNNSDMAVDLVRNDKPADCDNGTGWVDYLFLNESLSIINNHDTSTPLFLFHAFHSVHAPLNAPPELYVGNYTPPPCTKEDAMPTCFLKLGSLEHDDRRSYGAMVTFTDTGIGKMVDALKTKGMWDNTIVVVSADNGGAQYMSPIGYQLWGSGNNEPLRGGKTSEFEGGIRVNSFVTGGIIPEKMRGTESHDLMHFADWYGTFCYLAGCNQTDQVAIDNGLPDTDSINQWPILSGETTTPQRTDLQVSPVTLIDGAGKWKLLTGPDPGSINADTMPGFVPFDTYAVGYYTGYPYVAGAPPGGMIGSWDTACLKFKDKLVPEDFHRTINCSYGLDCTKGCLFNLDEDPTETTDVREQNPEIWAEMMAKLKNNSKEWTKEEKWGIFNPIRAGDDPRYNGPDKCVDNTCTSTLKCNEFVYVTGFYSWAADADDYAEAE
mmetsp:Transcript_122681/g.273894  ORF Transcript_122681/g.273894 Transcript_122681/m.273894 type:complete len:667 (+) Transcript_122681:80-2080(+)